MSRFRPLAALFGWLVLAAAPVAAQAGGTLAGRVVDDTGAALPGVTVEVRGGTLPAPRVASTDGDGGFRFDDVPAGTYRVTYQLLGFAGVAREAVAVAAGAEATADATLRLSVTADVLVSGRRTFRNVADVAEPGQSLVGIADASTQGAVTAEQIELRPIARAGDVLETIPGVVISQHSGEGKANQYYLRGFNLDHGTDFATTVAGVQVNFPTHAHGHGYTDLNFVVPELVSGIQYKKGPYFVEDGDFTTAGSANINYVNVLDAPIARVDGGSYQYLRGLFADSPKVGLGNLLFAVEGVYSNGPWVQGDAFRKYNGVLRYSVGDTRNGFAATFMGYSANWNSTDQVPLRAVEDGSLDRFGTIDTTDGGQSQRFSGSLEWQRSDSESVTRAVAYGLGYTMDLFSNFTYFLDDPVNGDQFEQLDDRNAYGLKATHRWLANWFGFQADNEVGFQGRYDDIHRIGLFHTVARRRISTTRLDAVDQGNAAVFFQNAMQWAPRFRTILGLRGDYYHFDVTGISDPENGGTASRGIFSPKLSMIFGPYAETELYANFGYGFHSNDARGATIRRDPVSGEPADPRHAARAGGLGGSRRAEHDPAALAVDARGLGSRDRVRAHLHRRRRLDRGLASEPPVRRRVEQLLPGPAVDDARPRLLVLEREIPRRSAHRGRQLHPGRRPERRRGGRVRRQHRGLLRIDPPPLLRAAPARRRRQHPLAGIDDRQPDGRLRARARAARADRGLQPLRRAGLGHRLLLRLTAAGGARRGGRRLPLPPDDAALGARIDHLRLLRRERGEG